MLISGVDCKRDFNLEPGIHRIQRVPPTERSGRRHTSTVAVSILPYVEFSDFHIPDKDIKIETTIGHGPGGQHRNKTESAVRITHIPTGISAYAQEKSQQQNRKTAMEVLVSRVHEKRRNSLNSSQNELRQGQIGNMSRNGKIRTYNFIEDRVKDERISKKFRTKDIMKGNLGLIYGELN